MRQVLRAPVVCAPGRTRSQLACQRVGAARQPPCPMCPWGGTRRQFRQ